MEDNGQFFFCDFFKAKNGNQYNVIVELAKQLVTRGFLYSKRVHRPMTSVPDTLLHMIVTYIHQAENGQLQ